MAGWYTCNLVEVQASSTQDIIDLSGNHIGGRTNADVTEIVAQHQTNVIEEIPSIIFDTFVNLDHFLIVDAFLRRIDLRNCGPNLRRVTIVDGTVSVLHSGAFRGCSTIDSLTLQSIGLNTIEENVFSDLPNLRDLWVTSNTITEIPEFLFPAQNQLEFVVLGDNQISSVHPRAFQSLTNVRMLSLDRNRIEVISAGTFSNLPSITTINCQFNAIRSIESVAFANIPNLQSLDLSFNAISSLGSHIFASQLPHFQILRINSNGLMAFERSVFDRMPLLTSLYATFNGCVHENFILIDSVETQIFPFMQECFNNFGL